MRAIVPFFALALVSSISAELVIPTDEELLKEVRSNTVICGHINGVSKTEINQIIGTGSITYPVSYNAKCFVKCLADLANFEENGELDKEKFIAVVRAYGQNEQDLRDYFDNCKHFYRNDSSCDPMWNVYMCFQGRIKYTE